MFGFFFRILISEISQKIFGRTDGNVSGRRRTHKRKFFGRSAGRTKIFPQSTPGRTDENGLPAGQPDARPARHPDGRTDGRTKKKTKKSKCVSNDRSGHDDQNEYRIIKNGAILKG